jgi:Xaa-Pro aminopeptidase
MNRLLGLLIVISILFAFVGEAITYSEEQPAVLKLRDRAKIINKLLKIRLERLLPKFMREGNFDMWLIICNEDNLDPVFKTIIPYDTWTPITQMVIFYDKGEGEIERLNISRTNMRGLYVDAWDPEKEEQWKCLVRMIAERDPKRIAINESEVIWGADGLTSTLKQRLVKEIGPKYAARLHSSEKLAIRWLATLTEEELSLYHHIVSISHHLIAEAFSNKVITPGVTTTEDLNWHFWQRIADLGMTGFIPQFRIWARRNAIKEKYDPSDKVIRRGDMLHCDVGISYLRLKTDTLENAYVLLEGESDVPEGLKKAMAMGNRLQDVFTAEFKQGLTGNEILANTLNSAKKAGISKPRIYSHAIGFFVHEPGPLIGLPWEQVRCPGRGDVKLDYNMCFAIELSVTCPIPEWDGQEVLMGLEQNAAFTKEGVIFLDGRQTEFHIIK